MKKIFFIYIKDNGDRKAVKLGWYWPGFLFSFIWSACMQLWLAAISSFILFVLYFALQFSTNDPLGSIIFSIISLLFISIRIIFGYFGNSWKRKRLEKIGYIYSKTVIACNKKDAILSYINNENLVTTLN